MVDRARAADAGRLRRFRVLDPTAARVGPRVPAPVLPLEAERSEELVARPAVRADALEALQCELPRDLGMARHERLVLDLRDHELVCKPFRIGEAEGLAIGLDLVSLRAEPVGPELERVRRADAPDDRVDHPVAGLAGPRVRVLEERDVGARVSLLVRIEEVVDGRVVLVDGLLDEPQPEDAGVEVDVPGRVGRDARDVVDPVEAQPSALLGREQLLRGLQIRLAHEDLPGSGRDEILERRIDRLRVPVGTVDARRPEQTAHHFCLGSSGYHCQDNRVTRFHAAKATRRVAREVRVHRRVEPPCST